MTPTSRTPASSKPRWFAVWAVCLAAPVVLLALPCLSDAPHDASAVAATDPMTPAQLDAAIRQGRNGLRPLVPGSDLLDSLYFGWFDRPYRRATLACAFKTLAVLDHEHRLRALGNGAIPDEQLQAMLDWLHAVPARAAQPARRPSFAPDYLRCDLASVLHPPGAMFAGLHSLRWFGFTDRATVTPRQVWSGDFDLLASLGFRVIARPATTEPGSPQPRNLIERAGAIGVTLLQTHPRPDVAPAPRTEGAYDASDASDDETRALLRMTAGTLADFVRPSEQTDNHHFDKLSAVLDRPAGESWPESLARRALYRGVTGRPFSVVSGYRAPWMASSSDDRARQFALAMWVHALDGQRLGVIEGWRDLRDGSAPEYPSLTADPRLIETISHTALDILYLGNALLRFDRPRRVGVVVRDDCVHPKDANRWAKPYARLFEALVSASIPFDVIPETMLPLPATRDDSHGIFVAPPDELLAPKARLALALRTQRGAKRVTCLPDHSDLDTVAAQVRRSLPPGVDIVVRAATGDAPTGLLLFFDHHGACALANPTPFPKAVTITRHDGSSTGPMHDLIAGRSIANPADRFAVAPFQVCLLVPQDSRP